MTIQTGCSPVITLPVDPVRVAQLQAKLREYQGRIPSTTNQQLALLYRTKLLERLFRDGTVETWAFSKELATEDGGDLDVKAFNQACGVIRDYCETGGANTTGGTGLSEVT